MLRLKDYNRNTLMLWWAKAPSTERVATVIREAKAHYIDREDLEEPAVRRFMTRLWRRRGYMPRNRAPTREDYDAAAERFLEEWNAQEQQ